MSMTDEAREAERRAARASALGISEWQLECIEKNTGIGAAMKEDLAALSRVQQPRSMATKPAEAPVAKGSGWSKPIPVTQPEGVKYVDAMCEHQDALDLVERLRKLKP